MYNVSSKNLIPICILRILMQHSDVDHPLRQEDIARYLDREYNLSIERKAIGRTLSHLRDELEIDILQSREGSWLASRKFEDFEIRFLIDLVKSYKYISKSDAKSIVNNLCDLSSDYFRSNSDHRILFDMGHKVNNHGVLINQMLFEEAIEQNRKTRFTYGDSKTKRVLNPWFILLRNERYYVIGMEEDMETGETKDREILTLDMIHSVSIIDEYMKAISLPSGCSSEHSYFMRIAASYDNEALL